MAPDTGLLRDVYLKAATGVRRAVDGTAVLRSWDAHVAAHPRSTSAHLRTLLAVHNAEDLLVMDLPWWTYQSMDVVAGFLRGRDNDARVFEYGSGASTVWLARRCSSLDSVEHDAEWAIRVRALVDSQPGLSCRPTLHTAMVPRSSAPVVASGAPTGAGLDFRDYVHTIDQLEGTFDLVLVDGRAREAALLHTLERVAPGGMLLLDDAQRPRYRSAIQAARSRGWHVLRTRGATPCQPLPRETVLLSRTPITFARE